MVRYILMTQELAQTVINTSVELC